MARTLLMGSVLAGAGFLAACAGGPASDTLTTLTAETVASDTPTTGTEALTTTTTLAPTTTTTLAPTTTTMKVVEGDAVQGLFERYFDLVVAKDYEGARRLATGPAADYATFVEHINLISPQPEWQLEGSSDPGCCDAILLEDGRYATASALTYASSDGTELAVSNPAVDVAASDLVLSEWGVDVGAGTDQPPLGQRLQGISSSPRPDITSCEVGGLWAYIPGGSDISTEVRIIAVGRGCDFNHDLVPQAAASRLYAEDGSVDITATTFLVQGGADTIPVTTPMVFLAIFDVPREAVSSSLIWETPFDRVGLPATTVVEANIGAFDLDF